MGGKKGSDETPYIDYHLSFHMGFCAGPVDSLMAVYMKEKIVFETEMFGGGYMRVNEQELFGGNQREGGVAGDIHFMNGDWNQVAPHPLASRLGLLQGDCPAFRGICSLAFFGNEDINVPGFKVSSNYPSVPGVWARFRRASWWLGSQTAIIENVQVVTVKQPVEGGEEGEEEEVEVTRTWFDSNPAHVIYECLLDSVWGMGGRPELLDIESFQNAANTLYEENFGISFIWTRQSTIESMIQEILTHINGMFYFSPRTGLGTLKLLRDDYDIDDLREFGPSNSKLLTFRRKLWGETVNEITISWTNPSTQEEETITYQSLGNIAMQGDVVSETRSYYMVRSAHLASTLGARDIVSASYPLASATVELDRRQWDLVPGDVIKLAWPVEGYNISQIIMRVMEIDYGNVADSKITVELLEDVFGLDSAEFIEPPISEWQDPDQDPNDPIYLVPMPAKFVAAPYPMIQNIPLYELDDENYPVIVVAALIARTPDMTDLIGFNLWKPGYDSLGNANWQNLGEKSICGRAVLRGSMVQEARSTMTISGFTGKTIGPAVGMYVLLDGGGEFEDELCIISKNLGDGEWEIERGIIDTVPHAWTSGTVVWFIPEYFNAFDTREPMADTTLTYRVQPRTSGGSTDFDLLVDQTTTRPARHYFPFRPANLKVDGVPFGVANHSGNHDPRDWTISVTWSNRHRMNEDAILRKWDEGPVSPEPGQTTTVSLNDDSLIWENLNGNSLAVDVMETGRALAFNVEAKSFRDDFESLQHHTVGLRLYPKGFGSDWGYFYGGWPGDYLDIAEMWEFIYDDHGFDAYLADTSVEGEGWMNYTPLSDDAHLEKTAILHDADDIPVVMAEIMRSDELGGVGTWIGELSFKIEDGEFDDFPSVAISAPVDAEEGFVVVRWEMTGATGWSGSVTGLRFKFWGEGHHEDVDPETGSTYVTRETTRVMQITLSKE